MTYLQKNKIIILNALIPLVFGVYIYLKTGRGSMFETWVQKVFSFELDSSGTYSLAWVILRNWGCDFLWAYSLYWMLFLLLNRFTLGRYYSLFIVIFFSVLIELMQLIKVENMYFGTFDFIDIIVEMIAGLICYLMAKERFCFSV